MQLKIPYCFKETHLMKSVNGDVEREFKFKDYITVDVPINDSAVDILKVQYKMEHLQTTFKFDPLRSLFYRSLNQYDRDRGPVELAVFVDPEKFTEYKTQDVYVSMLRAMGKVLNANAEDNSMALMGSFSNHSSISKRSLKLVTTDKDKKVKEVEDFFSRAIIVDGNIFVQCEEPILGLCATEDGKRLDICVGDGVNGLFGTHPIGELVCLDDHIDTKTANVLDFESFKSSDEGIINNDIGDVEVFAAQHFKHNSMVADTLRVASFLVNEKLKDIRHAPREYIDILLDARDILDRYELEKRDPDASPDSLEISSMAKAEEIAIEIFPNLHRVCKDFLSEKELKVVEETKMRLLRRDVYIGAGLNL